MNEKSDLHRPMSRRRGVAHCTALLALAFGGFGMPLAQAAPASAAASGPRILVVGDSLSAEYGLDRGSGWVALLERRLEQERILGRVTNASISGDTTAGGRSRLPALLKQHRPDVVILELGGNDALRGLPLESTQANLAAMARAAREAGARVLILGMQIPPNYGRQYADRFAALFGEVARAEQAALVPFLLKGVADTANAESMFQADRIHLIAAAHPKILANVWPALRPLLKS
jgi:acyl-CoA thioesterase-1